MAGRRPAPLVFALLLLPLLMCGCSSAPPIQPATGTAYAGPANLNLRSELGAKSQVVATAKHGDRLEVLEIRRRFAKLRTSAGVEGWTDVNLLLSEQQMSDLRGLAAVAAKLPSQGTATVSTALNVHAEPYRQSASFFQIPDGGSVEVIGHRRAPHAEPPPMPKPAVHRAPKKTKAKAQPSSSLRPPPPAPRPPADWLESSRRQASAASAAKLAAAQQVPVQEDDWFLVRNHSGDTGWALSRFLAMSIPDEVAQYAEGHRITAYLPLGSARDSVKNEVKNDWVWTTASSGLRVYDFDSFRVFTWSSKRHHYETALIERNVKGYYPLESVTVPGQDEKAFSIVIEDKDGKLYKRTYAFNGYHLRITSKIPYEPPPPLPQVHASGGFEAGPPPPASSSWSEKVGEWRKKWLGR